MRGVPNTLPPKPDPCQRSLVFAPGYLLLILAAAVPEAETGKKPVEVQFEGPAGCGGTGSFFASLRSRMEHVRIAEDDESRTTLQVRLSRERTRVVGELRIIDDSGTTDMRKVQGMSCDDVLQALSLTAALALDPTAVLSVSPMGSDKDATTAGAPAGPEPPPPSRADEAPAPVAEKPAAPPAPKPSEPSVTVSAAPPPPRHVPSVEVGAGLVGLSLLSGGSSLGAALSLYKSLGSGEVFRPAVGLTLIYARNDVHHTPSPAAATLLAAGISVCPVRVNASVLALQPCAALWGGVLEAAGRSLTQEERVSRLWLSTGLSLRSLVSLGHGLALQVEGGFQVPFLRRRYFATVPSNVIAETPTLSPVVGVSLTYGF